MTCCIQQLETTDSRWHDLVIEQKREDFVLCLLRRSLVSKQSSFTSKQTICFLVILVRLVVVTLFLHFWPARFDSLTFITFCQLAKIVQFTTRWVPQTRDHNRVSYFIFYFLCLCIFSWNDYHQKRCVFQTKT